MGVFARAAFPLNTCQVCRLVNGADHKNDVDFCHKTKIVARGQSNFKRWGHEPYEFCKDHAFRNTDVRRCLERLERRKLLKSAYLRHHDPQKVGRHWDRMRFYGFDLSPILREHIDHYGGGAS